MEALCGLVNKSKEDESERGSELQRLLKEVDTLRKQCAKLGEEKDEALLNIAAKNQQFKEYNYKVRILTKLSHRKILDKKTFWHCVLK